MDLIGKILAVVVGLFFCWFFGLLLICFVWSSYEQYQRFLKERARSNVPRVRSIRRWALLLSCATAALSYALGAHLVALISVIGAGLLAAPLLCNGVVIAFRTVAGWYYR